MAKVFQENSIIPILGNEAVVVGALEAGVGFVSHYPGCPAAEIGDVFYKIKEDYGVYVEYSTNEIVALEAGAGAAFSGVRSLVSMKHFGLNVTMDALIPIAYTKPRAGLVIVVADDPGCHSSAQSEMDSRVFVDNLLYIPVLDPSDPQEAKEFTKMAFEISEKFEKPVILRLTTRLSHQAAPVKVGVIPAPVIKGKFVRDEKRFNTMVSNVLSQKRELLAMKSKLEDFIATTKLNPVIDGSDKSAGIITSGVSHLYLLEAMKKLNVSLPVLKIDTFYPLPSEKISRFFEGKSKVLVIEEVVGLIEERLRIEAQKKNLKIEIFGKNLLEPVGELDSDRVAEALAGFLGIKYEKPKEIELNLVRRTPRFCPGCPYWLIYETVKNNVDKNEVVFSGDIGCYMIGYFPPYEMQDTLLCMGASVSVGHGISKATGQKVIAFIGDSTLFHSGLQGIINIINNESSPLVIIFNNGITAMTGKQPHPATPLEFKTHDGKANIKIENLLESVGFKNVTVLDPGTQNALLKEKIKEWLSKNEPMAIICRRPCVYIAQLEKAEIKY